MDYDLRLHIFLKTKLNTNHKWHGPDVVDEEEEMHKKRGIDRHVIHDLANRSVSTAQHQSRKFQRFVIN